jgi:hypothetical protein
MEETRYAIGALVGTRSAETYSTQSKEFGEKTISKIIRVLEFRYGFINVFGIACLVFFDICLRTRSRTLPGKAS